MFSWFNRNNKTNITVAKLRKLTVYGYIRQIDGLLLVNKSTADNIQTYIPDAIIGLCFRFYFVNTDEWDINCKGDDIEIAVDSNTIYKNNNIYQSAFLVNRISTGIHKWSFKILQHRGVSNIDIGIWKTQNYGEPITNNYFTKKRNNGYAYITTIALLTLENSAGRYGARYGPKCKINDVIDMYLDMNKLELSFNVNTFMFGKAFDIENTTYRAVVDMYSKYDRVQLLSYQQIDKY